MLVVVAGKVEEKLWSGVNYVSLFTKKIIIFVMMICRRAVQRWVKITFIRSNGTTMRITKRTELSTSRNDGDNDNQGGIMITIYHTLYLQTIYTVPWKDDMTKTKSSRDTHVFMFKTWMVGWMESYENARIFHSCMHIHLKGIFSFDVFEIVLVSRMRF